MWVLALNTANGLIAGTPPAEGTFNITISATNVNGTGSGPLAITVGPSLATPIADAVDQPALAWATDAAHPWTRQTAITHDGIDAARSAAIANNQRTAFTLTIAGPSVMHFWWKVSSESGYDFLTISRDGTRLAAISGEVDWQERMVFVPAGTHTFEWAYAKDNATIGGSDAAWVDQVSFVPTDQSPPFFQRQGIRQKGRTVVERAAGDLHGPSSDV